MASHASKTMKQELKVRELLSADLREAAKKAGIAVRTESLVYVSVEKAFAANVPTEQTAGFELRQLKDGAVLMFIYLAFNREAVFRGQKLPNGFYAVKYIGTEKKLSAHLLDSSGKKVVECPAQISTQRLSKDQGPIPLPASASATAGGAGNWLGCISLDLSGKSHGVKYNIKIKVCV
jgi:hypothetical protein